jgi:two-component system LytT family response regulator
MIVDDEELARALLNEMLMRHADIEIVAECANGFEAVKAADEYKPDLIFLDVQMPKLDGFEVLELIGTDSAVVFVTAYDVYAMKAFEIHAVDYLLKPFSAERFDAALERAKERLHQRMPAASDLAATARLPSQHLERLVIKDGPRVHVVPVARIDYLEAQDDYVAVHIAGKQHLKQQTLSSLEEALDPGQFIRIHRSYVVNVERVIRIEPYTKDSRIVILQDGTKLPVSQSGYTRISKLMG